MKKSWIVLLPWCVAGIATAATTNEYVGVARLLNAATQWSPALAPTDPGNIRNWLIGGSSFNSWASATGDLVVNSASPAYRVYSDTVYVAAGINSLTNSSGVLYDLGFNVAGNADNRIVVKTGFDIASDVTNNVALKSTKWASTNDTNTITFNHAGSGILKISNNWVETPDIALVYNGTGGNKVVFGLASTYTGGTTLNNVSASMAINNSLGNSAGNVVLTNGASLDMATYTLGNKIVAAAGSDVKQVSVTGVARTSAIEAQGNMRLYNTSGTAQWNGNLVAGEGAELEVDNALNIVTQLGGTLSGTGTLRTSDKGTTLFNTGLNASGFNGDIVMDAGVVQFRNDNQFGSGNITLDGANLRGFINAATNLDYAVANDILVQADSRMAMTASTGLAGNDGSVTVNGTIVFTTNATLTLEAGGNADNFAAVNTLNINGGISESSSVGNVTIDNHWTTAYYTNSITKLFAANTYSGTTLVQFGRLQLVGDGSIDSSSVLEVQAGGILDVSTRTGGAYGFANIFRGKGRIDGAMTLTGLIQPGAGTGTLTFNDDLDLGGSGILAIEAYGYGNNDKLANDGGDTLTVGPDRIIQFNFSNWGEAEPVTNGTVFTVFENWANLAGSTPALAVIGLSGQSVDLSNLMVDGTVTVVPGSPFDSWAASYDLAGVDALETADPDVDGLNNLYEYGLGGDPTNSADRGTSPEFGTRNVGGTNYFGYIHPQLSDPNSGITYHLELNDDLVAGTWTNNGYLVYGTNVTGEALDYVTNLTTTVESKKYVRLIIEQN